MKVDQSQVPMHTGLVPEVHQPPGGRESEALMSFHSQLSQGPAALVRTCQRSREAGVEL